MTTAAAPTAPPLAPPAVPTGSQAPPRPSNPRVLLRGIRWETYEALLLDLDNSSIRLTYDRGSLEIMAPLFRHENYSGLLGRLIEILAEELNLDFKAAWSTTFKRADLARGLEPDRSFYIQHVAAIAGRMEIDLTTDPPPDLAIEVDNTSSSLNRMGIYGALRVPEVWRCDSEGLQIWLRKPDGSYELAAASPTFPTLPVGEVLPLLGQLVQMTDLPLIRALRAWVRANALPKS